MALTETPHLFEIFEDNEDVGMLVGGTILAEEFETEARNASHPTEELRPLGCIALKTQVKL